MTPSETDDQWYGTTGSRSPGCCSAYAFPPLVVLLIAVGALIAAARVPSDAPPMSVAPAASMMSSISSVFTPEVLYWSEPIARWSAGASLDPNLVATVMQIESCGDPHALSRAGAIGLFQVMPFHFEPGEAAFAPDANARRGLDYLGRALISAQGDARLAFAGYNGGIGVIHRPEWNWPAETVRYAYWGSGIYSDASSGTQASPRLQEWLSAGGESLCRSASQHVGLAQ